MPTPETNRKLATIAVFVLPVLVVKAAGVFLGPTPAQAVVEIAPAVAPPPTGLDAARVSTRVSDEATAYAQTLTDQPFGLVPLYYERLEDEGAGPVLTPVGEDPPPDFAVHMILASRLGNTALIDNATYRVGDMLGDTTWRITEINAETRSVTIADTETDRTVTNTVEYEHD